MTSMTKNEMETVKRNLSLVERGLPLDVPLSVLMIYPLFVKARIKAHQKAYNQRPDVKARINAHQKAYYQRPDVKARIEAYKRIYYQRPDVKARIKARLKAYYQRKIKR
jgi:hypothetical protein